MRRIRVLRVLGFSTVYFSVFLIHAVSFAIRKYSEVQAAEFSWYLQHPLNAVCAIFSELSRNPIFLISFFSIALCALLLGFITDFGLIFLKKYILDRRHSAESFKQ